ncbi:sulfotransferase [Aestuariibacter halophilus]|uniref:Sulfotransferase n=1 Tax=Fluctibacter halophilus TaxID=226011 RepID=A0ABS8G703_9ALTE|nr:tetratricopeptide repeat-containing sulfotransferase family protein [Aestuariibacter halophilus]MCC2616372.1 sulfotransferase [Aestuariibacter halophilus]
MTQTSSIERQIQQRLQQADVNGAIALADQHLAGATDAEKPPLLYLKAVAQRIAGALTDAHATLDDLLTRLPEHARGHQEKGYLFKAQGQCKAAAWHFYRACQSNPALLSSWRELKTLYQAQDNDTALMMATEQVNYLGQLPPPLLGALDLMFEGQLSQADQVCRRYLQQHKHDPQGLIILAQIAVRRKALLEAEFILDSCVALDPENQQARSDLAGVLAKLGRFAEALEHIEQLLVAQPDNPHYLTARATAWVGVGRIEDAILAYQQLIAAAPERAGLKVLLGHAYKALGRTADAIKAYQQAIACEPTFGDAYWSLANMKTYRFDDQQLAQMAHTASGELSLEDSIPLQFAMGKGWEDKREYDRAFSCYAKGNRLKRQNSGFAIQAIEQQVERTIAACDKQLFERHKGAGTDAPDPIFVVGLPRAGSTLLEQILSSHSQVDGTMELHHVLAQASRLGQKAPGYPENLREIQTDLFARFGQQYLEQTRAYRQQAPLFVDKMPNNFLHVGLIHLMLPNATIIDARRDPMACCFSGFKQLFGEGQEFTYDLDDIARYYKAYQRLMQHWDEVLPGKVLRVQHEEVIDDLEGQVRRLLAHCKLPFESGCLTFYETQRAIKTPSAEQVRQPIYRSGMQQWRNFASHLEPLLVHFNGAGADA